MARFRRTQKHCNGFDDYMAQRSLRERKRVEFKHGRKDAVDRRTPRAAPGDRATKAICTTAFATDWFNVLINHLDARKDLSEVVSEQWFYFYTMILSARPTSR